MNEDAVSGQGARVVPVLAAGGGVTLRPWRQDAADVASVLLAADDPQIRHYSPSISRVHAPPDAEKWLVDRHAPDRMEWAVEDVSAAIVGRVSLAQIDDDYHVAEVGYWVLPNGRRRGIATTSVSAVVAWACGEGGFGRLEIEHELENVASCRVAEACGFVLEGVKRGGIVVRGSRADVHLHGRLATD